MIPETDFASADLVIGQSDFISGSANQGGGVTANQKLRDELIHNTKYLIPDTEIFFPKKFLCTDNAAMIGAYAAFHPEEMSWNKITANPELYFE
ncbi:MAG: putative tRNA threonylcarbamoyladenosine biosynthesis protein Gcp [Candidatus Levybacteria bacterium GW2011_GWC2_37_7]|nr:MAG: putative tRNA threonylcarbamoyladenosine biosynthesis protein Gcp [Candidatus Levybacteria bacterium GW2011_GWC2_37_7]